MDYSPSPSRVKPQYAFLDNSIEMGRSDKPFRSSPLKNVSHTANNNNNRDGGFHDMQRKFYNKYSDLKPQDFNSMKPSKSASDTTDRLFKDVGTKVPVDDDVKISSNMVEKIIKENDKLKSDKDLLQSFAKGLKEKLLKYKEMNEGLKRELSETEDDLKGTEERAKSWKEKYEQMRSKCIELETEMETLKAEQKDQSQKKNDRPHQATSPEFNFNANNTQDIFGGLEQPSEVAECQPQAKPQGQAPTASSQQESIDSRIKFLESTIVNNGEQLGALKGEIEFLRGLLRDTQSKSPQTAQTTGHTREEQIQTEAGQVQAGPEQRLKEDEWVVKETFELSQLQSEVMQLQKKLEMREENLKRKSELKRQLLELSIQLERADEILKKTKVSPVTNVDVGTQQASSQATPKATPRTTALFHDPTCAECRQTKNQEGQAASPTAGKSHAHTPAPQHNHASEQDGATEPKHFHINGVKWY